MKPILVLQHLSADGPAYLASWLIRQSLPHVVLNTQAGDVFPQHLDAYSALAVLGGEMSANDPLPSLRQAETLILDAMARGRPVIGHCLGGQLMARALGARVVPAQAPEIGWQSIVVAPDAGAEAWFGAAEPQQVFQWHEEAFELPAGATSLARSAHCMHQAFAIGPHLAMQFHVEVDDEKVQRWSRQDTPEYRDQQHRFSSVQDGAAMRAGLAVHLSAQQRLAERIYTRWLSSVVTRMR